MCTAESDLLFTEKGTSLIESEKWTETSQNRWLIKNRAEGQVILKARVKKVLQGDKVVVEQLNDTKDTELTLQIRRCGGGIKPGKKGLHQL